jgi:hypothetical protein
MGERLNGIQEVGSSILPGSTNKPNIYNGLSTFGCFFHVERKVINSYKLIWAASAPLQSRQRALKAQQQWIDDPPNKT